MALKKPLTSQEAYSRLAVMCNRAEECTHALREKLRRWGVPYTQAENLIGKLQDARLVDDRRFAELFARQKLLYGGWGRYKIRAALMAKRIDRTDIDRALELLDEEDYRDVMVKVLRAAARRQPDRTYESKMKILRHGASRGFEPALMVEIVKSDELWDE